MYKKIIVPIAMDQLEHGESVLGIAEKLIDEGGEIVLLNVVEDLNAYAQGYMIVDFPLEMVEESRKQAKKTLEAMKTKHGINGRVEIRTGGAAAHFLDNGNGDHQSTGPPVLRGAMMVMTMPSLRHTVKDSALASNTMAPAVAIAAPQRPSVGISTTFSAMFSASVAA